MPIRPSDIHLPQFVSVLSVIDHHDTLVLLVTVGLTALLTMLSFVLNVLRTIAYNARSRAINGVFALLSLTTIAAMCIDFRTSRPSSQRVRVRIIMPSAVSTALGVMSAGAR